MNVGSNIADSLLEEPSENILARWLADDGVGARGGEGRA